MSNFVHIFISFLHREVKVSKVSPVQNLESKLNIVRINEYIYEHANYVKES